MKKISTLFKKDPNDLGRVINEGDPQNQWVMDGEGIATRKFDGSACAVIGGILHKRYDAKHGKAAPTFGIPCQEPDPISGHWPHWIPCERENPADKYFFEAFDATTVKWIDGTYELIGPKINGNPEKSDNHKLIPHGIECYASFVPTWDNIKTFLKITDIEGIVFHHKTDGRMCKIRKSDFGFKR